MAEKKTSRTLQNIQRSIENQEAERRRQAFKQRIQIARVGMKSFQEGKATEAASAFYSYIRILEDFKGVPEHGLNPSLFDRQKDLPEILLISGVYWDLAKLYDKTSSPDKHRDFMIFLQKYVMFTKGFPHENIAAETLRRYIRKGRPKHRSAFVNSYRTLSGKSCFIATSLIDVCEPATLDVLMRFRDETLHHSAPGRGFIGAYYALSPWLSRVLDRAPGFSRVIAGRFLDLFARLIHSREARQCV